MPFYGKRPPTTTVDLGEKKYNLYIYIYITEAFAGTTFFHVNTIFKK